MISSGIRTSTRRVTGTKYIAAATATANNQAAATWQPGYQLVITNPCTRGRGNSEPVELSGGKNRARTARLLNGVVVVRLQPLGPEHDAADWLMRLVREKAAKEIEEEIGVEKTTSATGLGIGSCSNTTAAHGEQNRVPTPHARTGGISFATVASGEFSQSASARMAGQDSSGRCASSTIRSGAADQFSLA